MALKRWLAVTVALAAIPFPGVEAAQEVNRPGFKSMIERTLSKVSGLAVAYDQKATSKEGTFLSKVMLKNGNLRMETEVQGMQTVMIRNKDGMFNYMPAEKMAMRLPELSPAQEAATHADNYAKYLSERDAKKVGVETLRGYACDVYAFTDETSGEVKAWVWQEKQFPIQMVSNGKSGTVTVEISSIQLPASLNDSLFVLPPDTQIMDMGALGGLMGAFTGTKGNQGARGAQGVDMQDLQNMMENLHREN